MRITIRMKRRTKKSNVRRPVWLARAGLVALMLLVGCQRAPKFQAENQKLVQAAATAISARKAEWLKQTADKLEKEHAASKVSDEEYTALHSILETAQQGDWEAAQKEIRGLEKAQ